MHDAADAEWSTSGERRQIMRSLLLRKVKVPSTLEKHLRNAARIEAWSMQRGLDPWRLGPPHFAYLLRDEGRGFKTAPGSLLQSATWLQAALKLP